MRTFSLILIFISLGLIVFNLTKINWSSPFDSDSMVAIITTMSLSCAILLLLILRTSKAIESKFKKRL